MSSREIAATQKYGVRKICCRNALDQASSFWNSLYSADRDSFFLSWHWISTWLSVLPDTYSPYVLAVECGDRPVFAMVVGVQSTRVCGTKACVGEVDDYFYDDLVIEQNGFLLSPSESIPDLVYVLDRANIDVLSLSKTSDEFLKLASTRMDLRSWQSSYRSVTTHFVDLALVKKAAAGYLSLLSRNRRAQIRKSMRLYEEAGKLEVNVADTLDQAQNYFTELVQLHQQEWVARGEKGTFSSDFNLSFHNQLIASTFESGLIGLYRIRCGGKTIGLIYGFRSRGEFLYYQSGFVYQEDNRFRPGQVCHALLIELLAEQGYQRYDFLAGESTYKSSLSTHNYLTQTVHFYSGSLASRIAYLWFELAKPALRKLR